MGSNRSHGLHLALLVVSIVCSTTALAALVFHPDGTGSWRTALNIIALLLVIATASMIARGSRGRDA